MQRAQRTQGNKEIKDREGKQQHEKDNKSVKQRSAVQKTVRTTVSSQWEMMAWLIIALLNAPRGMGEPSRGLKSFLKCLSEAPVSEFDLEIKAHLTNSESK